MGGDATRAEALSPALASALLLVACPCRPGRVHFVGDSEAVTSLLNRCEPPRDIFLYNCRELVRDALTGWGMRASWVSRVLNAECDALANSACITRELSFSPSVLPPSVHMAWRTVNSRIFSSLYSFGRSFGLNPLYLTSGAPRMTLGICCCCSPCLDLNRVPLRVRLCYRLPSGSQTI